MKMKGVKINKHETILGAYNDGNEDSLLVVKQKSNQNKGIISGNFWWHYA